MKKKKIGIIVAMDVEIDAIRTAMEDCRVSVVSGMTFYEGHIGKQAVVAALSGIGKVCAAMCAQTLILKYHPDEIIGAGIAGGLCELPHGGIVIAKDLVQHDFVLNAFGYEDGYLPSLKKVRIPCDAQIVETMIRASETLGVPCTVGTIASGDCFVNTSEKRNYITETYRAVACEMEGAAIAQVCAMNELPFCVIRCLSDSGDENADDDIETNEAMASSGSAALVLAYLREAEHGRE
ncbi:MAG: 5'-methylthioadenosine/adenosylhomocysteine nucleosidase [Lachnospiraceae bacterium]|nr:5'-methylthioadenosine/adenosylhomocysteine nucleosidase [Lachnospiraceae bacterium]